MSFIATVTLVVSAIDLVFCTTIRTLLRSIFRVDIVDFDSKLIGFVLYKG